MAMDMDDDILQDFLVESREILEELGEQLIELEQRPTDRELLNAVFRGFHTIKGGAGFLSLNPLVEVCHHTEDLFNLLRAGERQVTPDLMDAALQALDVVNSMFDEIDNGAELSAPPADLIAQLAELCAGDSAAPAAPAMAAEPVAAEPVAAADNHDDSDAEFEALLEALDRPDSTQAEPTPTSSNDEITEEEFEQLLDSLHGPGQFTGGAESPAPASTAAAVEGTESASAGSDEISDDEFEALLDSLHGQGKGPAGGTAETPAPEAAVSAAETVPKPAKPAAATPTPAPSEPQPATSPKKPAKSTKASKGDATVRVDTDKLDDIMNLVGELVLVRNRLSTLRGLIGDERMNHAVGDLELVTADLQNAVMKTRMQPIKKVFGRFPRVVRDLARSLKKEVSLELSGEETDLDKNLVEALADPLVHLVRNAVDHGIESPEERERAGKPRMGRVMLGAEQKGDHILLTIADDGKGMDAEALRRKVVEKGLLDQESAARLDEHDCFNLIFMPGFSTKTEISDVSGRGVGLDVVKTRISQLNGSIDIDSRLGEGTTLHIKVPLTLAILPTLMVMVAGRKFALPMSVVREIFELQTARTNMVDGRLVVMVRDKAMPLFFLERWIRRLEGTVTSQKAEALDGERQVITVIIGNQAVGFVVDEVLGLEEVVIKPLGKMLHGLPGIAGSTITGDGKISLIIDIPSLIKSFGKRM